LHLLTAAFGTKLPVSSGGADGTAIEGTARHAVLGLNGKGVDGHASMKRSWCRKSHEIKWPWSAVLTRELREAYVTRALEVIERDGKTPAGYVCVWNSLTLRHEIMVKTTDDHYVFRRLKMKTT
jgi:hypothetical protein